MHNNKDIEVNYNWNINFDWSLEDNASIVLTTSVVCLSFITVIGLFLLSVNNHRHFQNQEIVKCLETPKCSYSRNLGVTHNRGE